MGSFSIVTSAGAGAAREEQEIDPTADFMRLRGCRIVYASGREWFGRAGGHFVPVSAALEPEPDPAEVARMLCDEAAVAARYRTKADSGVHLARYVCRRMPTLDPERATRVAAGLERMYFRPVTSKELLLQGHRLNLDTLRRCSRTERELSDARRWWQYASAVDFAPRVEVHGVFEGGELAAYLLMLRCGSQVHVVQQASRDSLAHLFPDDTLTNSVARMILNDRPGREVGYGGGLFGVIPGNGEFFEEHGFQREIWRWHIVLNPRLQTLLGAAPLAPAIHLLASAFPGSRRLGYLDSALRMRTPPRFAG